jgi:hypothetical protein
MIKKYNKIFLSLFFLCLLIILFLYIINNYKTKLIFENFKNLIDIPEDIKYYRCNDKLLGPILKNIFNKNNIYQSNNDWDIYIPCGYNDVEEELKKIVIKNDNKKKYIFGINGCDTIVSKNKIWESFLNCYGRKDASKLMPESYILDDLNEMETFRKNYKSEDIYILKKNLQRKEGLKITKDYFEIIDAHNDDYKVVQKYIRNIYLINGRKVNLRVYLLIVIKNNTKYFYLCENGKCIYTNKKYNDNDFDFESNITSFNLDMSVYNDNPRDFNDLKKYINSENNSKILFERIDFLIKKVSICLSKNIYQSENIKNTISFQLFGIDIIFTKDFYPYLLEFNKGPDMSPRDNIDKNMKDIVQSDMFKIVGIIPNNNEENSYKLIYKK